MIIREVGIRFEITLDESWYYGKVYLGNICIYTRKEHISGQIVDQQHMLDELMTDFAASMHPPDPIDTYDY